MLYLTTQHLGAKALIKTCARHFPDRIGIEKCCFLGEGETRVHGEKPLGARTRPSNKHTTPSPAIEPGPHWWEASALTTAPSLLPPNGSEHYDFQSLQSSSLR